MFVSARNRRSRSRWSLYFASINSTVDVIGNRFTHKCQAQVALMNLSAFANSAFVSKQKTHGINMVKNGYNSISTRQL